MGTAQILWLFDRPIPFPNGPGRGLLGQILLSVWEGAAVRANTLRLLLVSVVTLCAVGESRSQSAGELFRACTGTDKLASTMCGMYMAGFMSGLTYEQITRGSGPQKICLPKGITGQQVQQVFEGFMRDYPKLQNEPKVDQPSFIIGLALRSAVHV
jgi:hypothetical protein